MPLNRETSKRAEGVGWYLSSYSDASDVLDTLSGDLDRLSIEPISSYYGDKKFKVTIIVEEI